MSGLRLVVSAPDDAVASILRQLAQQIDIIVWGMSSPAPRDTIDIVVTPYLGPVSCLSWLSTTSARLVQSLVIGYDGVSGVLPSGNVYANAAGVHETSTAELTLTLILASQRAIPRFVRDMDKRQWAPQMTESLADRTVLIMGHGGVGRAIEDRLKPFEVNIVRVARSARSDARGVIHASEDLLALLPSADVVIVAIPLTEQTRHTVNDAFLELMKENSLLVNVSRGPVADTDALVRHAGSGRVRLALDVTDPEPLPPDHPLYALDNVLITPHVGGASTAMLPRVARLLSQQITLLEAGAEPINVVLRT